MLEARRTCAGRPISTWRAATSTAAGSTARCLTAVGTRGQAPYKAVLTHGFVVDADGRKMSKSLGNVIAPKTVIDKYGAEILRLWVSASDYRDDVRISDNILKQLSDAYRRIRNTCRFMLGNLYDFDPAKDAVPAGQMLAIDRFALHSSSSWWTRRAGPTTSTSSTPSTTRCTTSARWIFRPSTWTS